MFAFVSAFPKSLHCTDEAQQAETVQCRDLGKADANANIYALPGAPRLWARKHHAMPECSNHRGSKLCPMASDKAFPSRVLNELRLQRSKCGIHLPAQVTVKPLHHPIALPWKHWYLTCPEEQERKYSYIFTEQIQRTAKDFTLLLRVSCIHNHQVTNIPAVNATNFIYYILKKIDGASSARMEQMPQPGLKPRSSSLRG